MNSYSTNNSVDPDDYFDSEFSENEDMMQVAYSEMPRLMPDGDGIQVEYMSEDDILTVLDMCSEL